MDIRSLTCETFPQALVEAVPELGHVLEKHLKEYDGELLPNVFLGDVTRYLLDMYKRSCGPAPDAEKCHTILNKALAFLEKVFTSSNEETSNLIGTGFLENLLGVVDDGFRALLGPACAADLVYQENWRPGTAK